MIWTLGVVVAAVLGNSTFTSPRIEDGEAFATSPPVMTVSISPGEAAYLSNVRTIAIRSRGEASAETATLVESLRIWLPSVEMVTSDDADLIIDWALYDRRNAAAEWHRTELWEGLIDLSNREQAPSLPEQQQANQDDEVAKINAGHLNQAAWSSVWLDLEFSPPLDSGLRVEQPNMHEVAPVLDAASLHWTASLSRTDCQSRSFTAKPYRPTDGRCETPVFVKTELAEIEGVAHDETGASIAFAEMLRELILGVPRGSVAQH